jgi:hypothetical protein
VVWVELAVPLFWLGPATVVDMWVGLWSCTSGMSPKVGCSGSSVMVGRFWVDSCLRGGPSFGCKHWLILLSGIARVVFGSGTRWAPNVWGK